MIPMVALRRLWLRQPHRHQGCAEVIKLPGFTYF
jgi:hypothetical protein